MIPGANGERPSETPTLVVKLLDNPAGEMRIAGQDLFGLVGARNVGAMVDRAAGPKPSVLTRMPDMWGKSKPVSNSWTDVFDIDFGRLTSSIGHVADSYKHADRRENLMSLLRGSTISRKVVSLDERDRALLRGHAAMYADGGLPINDWCLFYSVLTWNDGLGRLSFPEGRASQKQGADAYALFKDIVAMSLPSVAQAIADATSRLASYKPATSAYAQAITGSVTQGARWLSDDDLASGRVYANSPIPACLTVGQLQGKPLRFSGSESLITIGGPGSGKTQGQVIPNLLTYPGSVFVLDVKGELYEQTAQARRRFGAVHRFAPTDMSGHTQRYNPFDRISNQPDEAAVQCQVLAAELVPENADARDPYWNRRAQDLIWTFSMMTALLAKPEDRNLRQVSRYLSIPTHFATTEGSDWKRSKTRQIVKELEVLAEMTNISDLASAANAIQSGVTSNRLESVFDTARSQINSITRVPTAMAALSATDWNPLDLREAPGTSIYICLKPGDIRAFASVLRLIFSQHVKALTQNFERRNNVLPVTFFLDEMPQLGFMPGLSDIIDIGRGAALRLWIFAQNLGQIRSIYGARADGLINSCAVRCFLQPDLDAANFIAPQLGESIHMFTGERRPLAEPHELMGRAFADDIIALGRGEHPARLGKKLAYLEKAAPLFSMSDRR